MAVTDPEIQRLLEEQDRYEEILVQVFGELARRQREQAFEFYRPGKRHKEFFDYGAEYPERLFCAGNRCGKSTAGCFEDVCHLTGVYPDWWEGRRFSTPVEWALIGNTARQLRSAAQHILFGPPGQWGTGLIPQAAIRDIRTVHGVAGAIDFAVIEHAPTGGSSTIYLVSAEQGWQSLQGRKLHGVHLDEEPPKNVAMEIYTEIAARLIDTSGILLGTMTPQQGMTDFQGLFWDWESEDEEGEYAALKREGAKYRRLVRMEIWEAEHLTKEQIERFMALIPLHERDMRLKGIPALGEGRVWPLDERELKVASFDVRDRPRMRLIAGLDSGYQTSYTAIVWIAYDEAERTAYVIDCEKVRRQLVKDIAPLIKDRDYHYGFEVPVAWPRDISRREGASGLIPVDEYRKCGVKMLYEPSQFDDQRQHHVAPGLGLVWSWMAEGRFKVFDTPRLRPWFNEWQLFAYDEDGHVLKTKQRQNDLMDATRYAMVMLSRGFARSPEGRRRGLPRMTLAAPMVG